MVHHCHGRFSCHVNALYSKFFEIRVDLKNFEGKDEPHSTSDKLLVRITVIQVSSSSIEKNQQKNHIPEVSYMETCSCHQD